MRRRRSRRPRRRPPRRARPAEGRLERRRSERDAAPATSTNPSIPATAARIDRRARARGPRSPAWTSFTAASEPPRSIEPSDSDPTHQHEAVAREITDVHGARALVEDRSAQASIRGMNTSHVRSGEHLSPDRGRSGDVDADFDARGRLESLRRPLDDLAETRRGEHQHRRFRPPRFGREPLAGEDQRQRGEQQPPSA